MNPNDFDDSLKVKINIYLIFKELCGCRQQQKVQFTYTKPFYYVTLSFLLNRCIVLSLQYISLKIVFYFYNFFCSDSEPEISFTHMIDSSMLQL